MIKDNTACASCSGIKGEWNSVDGPAGSLRILTLDRAVFDSLISHCMANYPEKTFGLLLTSGDMMKPDEVYEIGKELSIRGSDTDVDESFREYGSFYDDSDNGFYVTGKNAKTMYDEIDDKGKEICALFHTHRKFLPWPNPADIDLHMDRDILCVIVGMRNPDMPEIGAYFIAHKGPTYEITPVLIEGQIPKENLFMRDVLLR